MTDSATVAGPLSGKVALITGASSGSGLAVAKRFAEAGASLVLLARGADRLAALEESLGGDVVGVPTDIGDPESVRSAFDVVRERHGKLDILVNNAGVHRSWPFELVSDDDILGMVRTNLLGPIYATREAIPLFRVTGGGDIVNTSSEATLEFFSYEAVYTATKKGLEGFSQALRNEFEKEEIRVTTLIQGVALGEGGGSEGWGHVANEHSEVTQAALMQDGVYRRIVGLHGGMKVDDVADVHLFVVTRPRGQKLDVIRVRSY